MLVEPTPTTTPQVDIPKPLAGRRVLVTRASEQSRDLAQPLAEVGAVVVVIPTIRFEAAPEHAALDRTLARADRYDWVAFTSANGVKFTCQRLEALGHDAADTLGRPKLAAVGPATRRALEARGLDASLVPEQHEAVSLASAMARSPGGLVGRKVLLPQGDQARPDMARLLRAAGAEVDAVIVYRNIPADPPPQLDALLAGGVDLITLASPSAARHLAAMLAAGGPACRAVLGAPAAAIGPQTSGAARQAGLRVVLEAIRHSAAGLAEACIAWLVQHPPETLR